MFLAPFQRPLVLASESIRDTSLTCGLRFVTFHLYFFPTIVLCDHVKHHLTHPFRLAPLTATARLHRPQSPLHGEAFLVMKALCKDLESCALAMICVPYLAEGLLMQDRPLG
jgi:hypothetical protein